jgi:N-acetylneuraminic acid mutarotase/glucose/arabinose dehydrogenase
MPRHCCGIAHNSQVPETGPASRRLSLTPYCRRRRPSKALLAIALLASLFGIQLLNLAGTAKAAAPGWSSAPPMPTALGEVAGGLIAGKLYVVGEDSTATLSYDIATETWTSSGLATRPFPGNHHAAEVVNGKLYLFGGLGGGSEGKVQIYDPVANQWTEGAPMPFAAGSSSSAVIGSQVYVAGGIVGSSTTTQAARYTPATDTWQAIAPMPQGRNHAAAESDGAKMFVFGGRGPGSGDGNFVANGFDTVQIYDPATDSWKSSLDPGSTLEPLPQARGGMGTAVFANGEFWVMGGETLDGPGATADHVYDRVDVYNPATNSWRTGPAMPTARHGIFPVLDGTRIHVAGGGVKAGGSSSTVHEVLDLEPAAAVAFSKSSLAGETSSLPTSLQFGPDGRLYVAQQNGAIKVYEVARNGKDSYAVTGTQTITSIQSIPNHDDDGTLNTSVTDRQVTGLLVVGTAANPVVYVSSSDPRIGAGEAGLQTGLDTNSGIISRLTWDGSSWQKVDLVRGLPRSEENHSTNGLQLDPATNTLYVAQGGNTNMGAPSHNFGNLPEYALSAAILSVDLDAIGNGTYDLPTLDDADRPGVNDAADPLGGDDGKNQAKLAPGGPVQVFEPGFRNPYDLLITESGRLYTIDNGSNAGWGDKPVNEGPGGTCTNQVAEPGTSDVDTLQLVTANGYGGHPNPTRGNMANTFSSPPQSPVSVANPVECEWRDAGPERGNITAYPESTNGLTEYTASNFGGQLKGDLLSASFDNKVHRAKLNSAGTQLVAGEALFQNVGELPLDVVAQGDDVVFPGTIWVADIGNGKITVFEPDDYGGSGGGTCSGADSTTLDEDGDGFKNSDEIDNGTNPCSSADVPPDRDGDATSDLNDPDDDNDGLPDTSDPFAIDPNNGETTTTPVRLTWDNDAPSPGGLANLGFTGLMTNGTSDYASLFDPAKMTAGGAAGVATVDEVSEGDAFESENTQEYGLQVGVMPPTDHFTVHTRILAPFKGIAPRDYQSMGMFIGTGDQDNYVKLVVSANGGAGGVEFLKEVDGIPSFTPQAPVALPGPSAIDLYLTVDPAAETVQPSFTVTTAGVTGPGVTVGGPEPIPGSWLSGTSALAAGLISTSIGSGHPFAATWDFFEIVAEPAPKPPDNPTVTPTTPDKPGSPPVVSNLFSFGKPRLNRKLGTAMLPVTIPGPGTLVLSDKGVVEQKKTPTAAGTVNMPVKAKGQKKQFLATGKVRVNVKVTFVPTGGTAKSKSKTLVLKSAPLRSASSSRDALRQRRRSRSSVSGSPPPPVPRRR